MTRKIIIPNWETLRANNLLSEINGHLCIRKTDYVNYLKRGNPDEGVFIDSLLNDWPSTSAYTRNGYTIFRKILKNRLRRFSDGNVRLILEGEERDDDV